MEITLETIKSAFSGNNLTPIAKSFGGRCANGEYCACPMVALYVEATKDFPTSWSDEEYNNKVCEYLRKYEPDINWLAIGWDNYFPIRDLHPRQKELFDLGQQLVKELVI